MSAAPRRLLRVGRLLDADRGALHGPVDVLVDGGRVLAVDTGLDAAGAGLVDLRDCTLLAGLVDLDADLVPGPVSGDAGLWVYRALAIARDLLAQGFTTARVLGGADRRWSLLDLRRALAEGIAPGCALVVAPHRLDDGPALTRAAAREARNDADWIAVDGRALDPAQPDAVRSAVSGTRVAIAAQTAQEVRWAIAAGAHSIEVSCPLDDETLRQAERRGVFVVPRDGFAAASTGGLALGFGGRLSGGIAALADITGARAALVAATSGAARCLGLRDRGRIAAGLRADLVAVAGDPLADPACLAAPAWVMHDGRVAA